MIRGRFNRNRLGLRVLAWVLLCNALLTILTTAVQLYSIYQRDRTVLVGSFDEIERGYHDSLEDALWRFDYTQVDKILDGLASRGDVSRLELIDGTGRKWVRGEGDLQDGLIIRAFPFERPDSQGNVEKIGALSVGLSVSRLWDNVWKQVLVVFLSNLAKTSIAAILILLIFHRLVSRHLLRIADHVAEEGWLEDSEPLQLRRDPADNADDLNAIVTAVNISKSRILSGIEVLNSVNHQMRLVLDTSVNGIVGLTPDGTVAIANPVARHLLGDTEKAVPFAWPEGIRFLEHSCYALRYVILPYGCFVQSNCFISLHTDELLSKLGICS